nr:unnamed protein product [Digitaria exilis]
MSSSSSVVYEGWMVRYGRRKIGRSFVHTRYFVLEPRMLSYYKRKPQNRADKVGGKLPIKSLPIDGNCRVEDRGLKMHHGHMLYVLCVYNKREKHNRITMAAFNIQEALIWKEKIEMVIDQQQGATQTDGNRVFSSSQQKANIENGRKSSSSDHESQYSHEEEEEEDDNQRSLLRRTTIGNGPPESLYDWTRENDLGISNQGSPDQASAFLRSSKMLITLWDCSFQYGSLVEEVDGHTAILYHRLQLDWFPIEHPNCGPQPGFVRAHIERLREWFSQSDESQVLPRIPVMVNMTPSVPSKKGRKAEENTMQTSLPMDPSRPSTVLEEESDEDDEFLIPECEQEEQESSTHEDAADVKQPGALGRDEEGSDQIDLSGFSGNLRRDDRDNSRDCWRISDGNNFRVRSKNFVYDKSKVPAGKPLMELVAVDWFKDTKRMDHVARRKGCAVQVPGTTNYSMVFYFVTKKLIPNSLLQRFVDGDDEFRNSRFKLIPSVPKGSWIVRQSVGSTPCLLGKAVDITYIRGANYLEIDVDIGSSTVANGVLGLVCGVITTLVVDMAFLVQGNTYEELPERLIGAVRMSHIELSSAIVPVLED